MTGPDLSSGFAPLLARVRTDVSAVMRVNAATGKKHAIWTRDALTPDALAHHLNGGPARGVALLEPEALGVRCGVFDLDSHRGEVPWSVMCRVAEDIVAQLDLVHGIEATVFRSSGGRGVHIYLMWEREQDTHSVRALMRGVLAGVDLGGVPVEIYPKQDYVPRGGFGNQVFLPLARESVPLEVIDLAGLVEPPEGKAAILREGWWRPSGLDVPVVARPRVREASAVVVWDGEAAGKALRVLRDCLEWLVGAIAAGKRAPMTRDEWRDAVWAIHHETGGSEQGRALAEWFSEATPGWDADAPGHLEVLWSGAQAGKAGGRTGASLRHEARELGWADPTRALDPDVFDVVPGSVVEDLDDLTGLSGGGFRVGGRDPFDGPGPELMPTGLNRDKLGRIDPDPVSVCAVLRRPDITGVALRWDFFRDEIAIATRGVTDDVTGSLQWRPFTDEDVMRLRTRLQEGVRFKPVPKDLVRDAVGVVARDAAINTAQLQLNELILTWHTNNQCRLGAVTPSPVTSTPSGAPS